MTKRIPHPQLAEVVHMPNGARSVRFKKGATLEQKIDALASIGCPCKDRPPLYMPNAPKTAKRKSRKSRKTRNRAG